MNGAAENPEPGPIRWKNPGAWLGVLGIGVLFIALRWNGYDVPLTRDEGEYAYSAQLLVHGVAPYEHAFLQKPPMVVYTYALANLIAPQVYWFPRVLAYICAAVATGLLGYIARMEFGRGVALPAMWLMTPMILLPNLEQFIANTEMFMLLPLMGTVAVYVHSRHSNDGAGHWLAAGFLGAASLWYKYTVLPLLVVLYAAWSLVDYQRGKSVARVGRHWVSAALGAAAASIIVTAFFLVHDGGARLWECTIRFNRYYAATATFGMAGLWLRLRIFLSSWWFMFLLIPCGLLAKRRARLRFWVAVFVGAWLTTSASHYGHYYVVVMPFWALLGAAAVNDLSVWLTGKMGRPIWWLPGAMTAVVVAAVCVTDLPWMRRSRSEFLTDKGGEALLGPMAVARRIGEITSPQDWVYVGGSEPEILYYAQRFSSTRFVITFPLMIPIPLAQRYQEEALREIQARPPAAIVLMRDASSWLRQEGTSMLIFDELGKMLSRDYERMGGYLYDGKDGRWEEPMPERDFKEAGLVLYKRKATQQAVDKAPHSATVIRSEMISK